MNIYGNSDFAFYMDEKGEYWVGYNKNDTPFKLGALEAVE